MQPEINEVQREPIAFEVKTTKSNQEASLQDAFKKYMQRKKLEKISCRQDDPHIPHRNQQYKDDLRKEFIERLKSYIGTPYTKLDCCGLIRRVLIDLQDKFGFKPLWYNQNYQMDTLPIRYESHKQMKPGDLIFYEGLYEKPGKKQQRHLITHVEVYLGPDEQCIGSRYSKKCVSLYDSYKFNATSWKLQKHYFCSIDTWLDGVCKSFCTRCVWKGEKERLEKNQKICRRSIFEPTSNYYINNKVDNGCNDDQSFEEFAKGNQNSISIDEVTDNLEDDEEEPRKEDIIENVAK